MTDAPSNPQSQIPSNDALEAAIEAAWENRSEITPATGGETREAIEDTLNELDSGQLRVA